MEKISYMKALIEFFNAIRFDVTLLGIQKNLLLSSLIGVLSSLPSNIKSKFLMTIHILVGTLLSTIMTPGVLSITETLFKVTLDNSASYMISALLGILGTSTIKKIIVNKLTKEDDIKPKDKD